MGSILVILFVGFFVVGIGQAIVRRLLNPYEDVDFSSLPEALRGEIARMLPGFHPSRARITRKRDEAHISGEYAGFAMHIEADLDEAGQLVELEAEAVGPRRITRRISRDEIPEAAIREVERVLGDASEEFEPRSCATGCVGDEAQFKLRGLARGFDWEISVSAAGRLLEVEMERPRRASDTRRAGSAA